jgi:hypothetical protein
MDNPKFSTVKELSNTLVEISKSFAFTFVVMDALDECNKQQRNSLLPMCHRLAESGIRPFVTSRPDADDIASSFERVPRVEIQAHRDDITDYIRDQIGTAQSWFDDEIISEMTRAADGM